MANNQNNHNMHDMHHDSMKHTDHDMSHMSMDHSKMDMSNHQMAGMDHSMHMGNFKKKFFVSLILAIPIILLSPMMGMTLPIQISFTGSEWIVMILSTILFFYGGQPFLSGARMELSQKQPAMMTLIAMGISVSYFYSLYGFIMSLVNPTTHVMNFFWELATLIVVMLLGHWIEMNAVSNASDSLKKIAALLPDNVTRITQSGKEEQVSLSDVHVNDQLIVRSGDKIPADGTIIKGSTTVNEFMITGESQGIVKNIDDKVIGGTINGNGTIEIKVTGTGKTGYISKVMDMVQQAQNEKIPLESLSDKVAKWLFYVALGSGIISFIIWLIISKDVGIAFERMVTVLVIACPHALGLAIPLVIARSTSLAAQNGLLLKNKKALEATNHIEYVFLDKTGTLTQGQFAVTGFNMISDRLSENEALKIIGALEKNANHPIATGIMDYINQKQLTPYDSSDTQAISGVGVTAVVNGKTAKIVNEKGLTDVSNQFNPSIKKEYQEQGNTLSFLIYDGLLIAMIALGDTIKPESKEFIAKLKEQGITPVMLTGDNQQAADTVAKYLGLDHYYSELLPGDKEKIVKEYVNKGDKVMMVGDGVNDAPSLISATVGVAIGAGTDVAIDSADIVLTNSNPEDVLKLLSLAKHTRRKMIQNLWWGAGYNIVAIPLAAGVLAPIGILLNPAVGAVFMSLSTVIVAINALTLRIGKE
ncbi:heavy metal translocating P-type ATPase [Vagococcus luciliae]|uniref:P-type Cu(+) transporter n=1 Tax=Vagococcus luciliae TaxID=2920380 RepID=A0ABY5P0A6_9ENTE|nr:copper-translocating P-type ATPase [Vagococcus luciliae]UUV99361.1 Copper-exporting P-type ATPase B [Vagococcus luciliae]